MTTETRTAMIAKLHELSARQAEKSLGEFCRQAWHIVEPDIECVWNWHLDHLCELYEAVVEGDLRVKNVIVNIPPGCMKSLIVAVFMPAWAWIRYPSKRFLFVSYDQDLSTRDNLKCRQIIESDWFQRRWGHRVQLADDQNQKTRYNTSKGGWRIGTSINGAATGEHPDIKVIDDPHNVKKAMSDDERKTAIRFVSLTLPTRGASRRAATIITMQRLHQSDVSGYLLQNNTGKWVHYCLPMRYEPPAVDALTGAVVPRMPVSPLGHRDPRTTPGELLWPALFPAPVVHDLEAQLLEFGTAGQMQQRPVPEGGAIFLRAKFRIIDALPAGVRIRAKGRGWDHAASENHGDWTAGVLVFLSYDGTIYIVDVVRERIGPDDADALLLTTTEADAARYGDDIRVRIEQEGGSAGKKVASANVKLLAGHDVSSERSTGSKPSRARSLAAQQRVGNVVLLRGHWNTAFIDEFGHFPAGDHDDQVDAASLIYNDLALAPVNQIAEVAISGF